MENKDLKDLVEPKVVEAKAVAPKRTWTMNTSVIGGDIEQSDLIVLTIPMPGYTKDGVVYEATERNRVYAKSSGKFSRPLNAQVRSVTAVNGKPAPKGTMIIDIFVEDGVDPNTSLDF